jgi:uncharacterized membrane protein YdbT with pleckstrin-like domain
MSLIECPDCRKPVSTSARACPNCGYPVAEKLAAAQQTTAAAAAPTSDPSELLAEVRTSWWGYFWYLFFFWLLVPPLIAYLKRSSMVLRIYPERLTVERGIFSKCYQDMNPRDIRSIDLDQSFFDRLVNIGDLTISTAVTVDAAEQLRSIPDPQRVRELIIAQRQGAKTPVQRPE